MISLVLGVALIILGILALVKVGVALAIIVGVGFILVGAYLLVSASTTLRS